LGEWEAAKDQGSFGLQTSEGRSCIASQKAQRWNRWMYIKCKELISSTCNYSLLRCSNDWSIFR